MGILLKKSIEGGIQSVANASLVVVLRRGLVRGGGLFVTREEDLSYEPRQIGETSCLGHPPMDISPISQFETKILQAPPLLVLYLV